MVHFKVIRVVHPFRCYHVIFARDNCRMVVYGYKPDTLVAVATLWLHYGYIMAIVHQQRLLADLGPEYVILVQTCHLSVEVSSIKSNFSQQTHTAL